MPNYRLTLSLLLLASQFAPVGAALATPWTDDCYEEIAPYYREFDVPSMIPGSQRSCCSAVP